VKRKSTPARMGAALVLASVVLVLAGGPALAADIVVSNSETVQAHLNADGSVRDARVYEQIGLQGKGTVTIKNPVSTDNLRNLDGFDSFEVQDGQMVSTQSVDGEARLRGVSDYAKQLPLKVSVAYKLDGRTVEAGDVVGKAGHLDVRYKVENVTGRDQNLTYDDGTGQQLSHTEKVVIPMVSSLTTVLPTNFVDVSSNEANMAGDGRGQTKMSFTMTLFGPIGSPISEFGYSATVTEGLIPDATISALPVSPLDSPSFKGGAASYKGGADTGAKLTAGATEIDANVLKLRDGAQTLIGGLIQLRDGAQKLDAGLAGKAAPGANKLADGASRLNSGAGQLAAGAGDAKAGSGRLAAGSAKLDVGARKLDAGVGALKDGLTQGSKDGPPLLDALGLVTDGLKGVDHGLDQLYRGIGRLPAKVQPLHDGIHEVLNGIGDAGTADSLAFGVKQIQAGLAAATAPKGSLDQLKGGVDLSKGGVDLSKGGADAIKDKLEAALVPETGSIAQLQGGVRQAKGLASCLGDSTCQAVIGSVSGGLEKLVSDLTHAQAGLGHVSAGLGEVSAGLGEVSPGLGLLKTKLSEASEGLIRIECGLDNTAFDVKAIDGKVIEGCDADSRTPGVQKLPGLRQGLELVGSGVDVLVGKVIGQVQGTVGQAADVAPAQTTLRGGVHAVMGGIDLIGKGGLTLIDGMDRLMAGTGEVATGAGQLRAGAGQLDAGLGKLSGGAADLNDGTNRLSGGANDLAAGVDKAATGSGKLSDGLVKASEDGQALPDGATRLSAEGTSKLGEKGKSTASDYGLKYAVIVAGAERGKAEAMAYGAPAGAAGTTAYSLEISGANGDGGTSLNRGVGALALFGSGGGLVLFRRRLV
jgi:X-X-X-Leu-X-X-Gly heptad repeat protein